MNPTATADQARTKRIALVGNPNTGKTTLFNCLTGLNQKVGNYPGVTVERKTGVFQLDSRRIELFDLPGTYSLAARSLDEMVVTDLLLGKMNEAPIELVIAIVDASNIFRNFYLISQLIELGKPVIIAMNMTDVASSKGIRIDFEGLSDRLGLPVIPVCASRYKGIEELRRAISAAIEGPPPFPKTLPAFPENVQEALNRLRKALGNNSGGAAAVTDVELFRALVDENGCAEERIANLRGPEFKNALRSARESAAGNLPLSAIEAKTRYQWVNETLAGLVVRPERETGTLSDTIDKIVTHKVFGYVLFAALMATVFQAIYTWAAPLMDLIDGAFSSLGGLVYAIMPEGTLRSLVVDGIIAGVGGVLIFLPQIVLLFLFIALLEDCGYMPRAAFMMDKILSRFGLSGKSFIPMLSSFACAIPGIMATRTIDDRRDRLTTILVAPLMSCSARLPVYIIFIAAFVPNTPLLGSWIGLQGVTLFMMYLLGILVAIPVAWLFKKTLFRGEPSSFLMELPSYKIPNARTVFFYVFDRAKAFIYRAGTMIVCVTVVVWALAYFPRPASIMDRFEERRSTLREQLAAQVQPLLNEWDSDTYAGADGPETLAEALANDTRLESPPSPAAERVSEAWNQYLQELETIDTLEEGELLRHSFLGMAGRWVEPVVEPLGWDWRIGMATLASFPAREIIIATMGIILNMGGEVDEESTSLRNAMRETTREDGTPLFTLPVALSIMVFFALCCQCAATLATIYRETNSWRWPALSFAYMTVLAYAAAFVTYHSARFMGL